MLSALFLVNKLESEVKVQSELEENKRIYVVKGQIFFSSAEKFYQFFDFNEIVESVEIDLTHAHIWDITSVNMLANVVAKFESKNNHVEVIGLNQASATLIDRVCD